MSARPTIGERQGARYMATRPGRNKGPKGAWPTARSWRTTHRVECASAGINEALTKPMHSRRHCKQALKRLRMRHPDAYGVTIKTAGRPRIHHAEDERREARL